MIVTLNNFEDALSDVTKCTEISVDTETNGLYPYRGNRLFSIIVAGPTFSHYFNFHKNDDIPDEFVLTQEHLKRVGDALRTPYKFVFMHNAKFDLAMLANEGIEINGTIHDTMVGARIAFNEHDNYKLDNCVKRAGLGKKDTSVETYIFKHKLVEIKQVNKQATDIVNKKVRNKLYHKVPFDLITKYGIRDAELTYKLGHYQLGEIRKISARRLFSNYKKPTPEDVLPYEYAITKVVFEMEKVGIKVDREYCKKASDFYLDLNKSVKREFETKSGFGFKDSGKHLSMVFHHLGIELPKTDKGNPETSEEVLSSLKNPVAKLVLQYRENRKRVTTYFENFLLFSDQDGIIHTDLRQCGTKTNRFSCSTPNFQNLTKRADKTAVYPIRRAVVPRDDFVFVMIDYDQMEFRLMLDYANEKDLIEKIKNGHDPHQATADETGLERDVAKTLNFGLLYGMGVASLAKDLGSSKHRASYFRKKYFRALSRVRRFINAAKTRAETFGFVFSWDGRYYVFPDRSKAYRAANRIISGGCAGVVKRAMISCHDFLKAYKSRMILQVHDELLFEIHKTELHIIPQLKSLMESAYPYKYMPLTCSVSHSYTSWADEIEGMPKGAERESLQTQGEERLESTSFSLQKGVVSENSGSHCQGST